MCLLTAIGVTAIFAFNGIGDALRENYQDFKSVTNAPDAFVTTDLCDFVSKDAEILNIEGVKSYYKSAYLPCSAKLENSSDTKAAQLYTFSFTDEYKAYKDFEGEDDPELPDVYVEYGFAMVNNIKPNSKINVGYYDKSTTVNVKGIVSFPDTLKYGANNAVSNDGSNFGRIYVEREQLEEIITTLKALLTEFVNDPTFPEYIRLQAQFLLVLFDQYTEKAADEIARYGNRLVFYFDEGADKTQTLENINKTLNQFTKVNESYLFEQSISETTIIANEDGLKKAGSAISIFVFATVEIVLTLFLLQIIRDMMRDIGVMSAIGIRKEKIMVLLACFSLLIAVIGSILGAIFGELIEWGLDWLVADTFKLDALFPPFRFKYFFLSMGMTILASQFATFFASIKIFKLSPVDALNECATSKKVLPPSIDKKLENASPTTRLTVNSLVTKPKRFITSFLAIFASAILIFTATASFTSYNKSLEHTFDTCLKYDSQVIFQQAPTNFNTELDEIGAEDYEISKYAGAEAKFNNKTFAITVQGLSIGTNKVQLPSKGNNNTPIPEDGITVNIVTADMYGINEGDVININNKDVKVAYITQFELANICYCNIEKMEEYVGGSATSYLIKKVNKEALLHLITNYHYDATVTFTEDVRTHYSNDFKAIKAACLVFIVFSVGLGALIVTLMMQTSLAEQKRDLCIMRSIGFTMPQISALWSVNTIAQYILATACGIPLGFLVTNLILKGTETEVHRIFSYANVWHALITLGAIALFLFVSHLFSMRVVKKLNIAENTKNRE